MESGEFWMLLLAGIFLLFIVCEAIKDSSAVASLVNSVTAHFGRRWHIFLLPISSTFDIHYFQEYFPYVTNRLQQ